MSRPTEQQARDAIEQFMGEVVPDWPYYRLVEDGEDGWAFWITESDTTSYVHHDLRIEWYGTDAACRRLTPPKPNP